MTNRKQLKAPPMTTPTEPPASYNKSRTARLARTRLARHLQGFDDDEKIWWHVQRKVPEAWATLAEDIDSPEPRRKVTLRLDDSVVRFFRALGPGYQAHMNRVLATYAQMQIGQIERQRQTMREIADEYGTVFSDEARETYIELRPTVADMEPAQLDALDLLFGVK